MLENYTFAGEEAGKSCSFEALKALNLTVGHILDNGCEGGMAATERLLKPTSAVQARDQVRWKGAILWRQKETDKAKNKLQTSSSVKV